MFARIVLVFATIFTVALAVACGGDDGAPTPTPTAAPSLTATPSPAGTPSIPGGAVTLSLADPAPLPQEIALILETGCFQCDGPTTGFARAYAGPDGTPIVETLLDAEKMGFRWVYGIKDGQVHEEEPYITGFAMAPDASEMFISACSLGACGSAGMLDWSPRSETVILRSTDGGVSWTELGRVTVGGFVIAYAGPGRAIVGVKAEGAPTSFAYFPGLEPLPAPEPDAWPAVVVEGEVLWHDWGGRLLRSDGSEVAGFGESAHIMRVARSHGSPDGGIMVSWSWDVGGPDEGYYLSYLDAGSELSGTYEIDAFAMARVDLGKGLVIGNAEVGSYASATPPPPGEITYFPSLFDLSSMVVKPITAFANPALPKGRNHVVAVQHGPFLRVSGADACLPVYEMPGGSSPRVECLANGVLLLDVYSAQKIAVMTPDAGPEWKKVITPSGKTGYAHARYLER